MSRILPTPEEVDNLQWKLCVDYPSAAHQLIKLVDGGWNEDCPVADDKFLDQVRKAILIRSPNVFAGGTEEEREFRRRLIEALPEATVIELVGEFLRQAPLYIVYTKSDGIRAESGQRD